MRARERRSIERGGADALKIGTMARRTMGLIKPLPLRDLLQCVRSGAFTRQARCNVPAFGLVSGRRLRDNRDGLTARVVLCRLTCVQPVCNDARLSELRQIRRLL